jgi:hypothetical protein
LSFKLSEAIKTEKNYNGANHAEVRAALSLVFRKKNRTTYRSKPRRERAQLNGGAFSQARLG